MYTNDTYDTQYMSLCYLIKPAPETILQRSQSLSCVIWDYALVTMYISNTSICLFISNFGSGTFLSAASYALATQIIEMLTMDTISPPFETPCSPCPHNGHHHIYNSNNKPHCVSKLENLTLAAHKQLADLLTSSPQGYLVEYTLFCHSTHHQWIRLLNLAQF